MLIYLDNCCFNRPFDDQSQVSVRLEAIAKLAVQLLMATKKVEYAWSGILDYEISFNPNPRRKTAIQRWREWTKTHVPTTTGLLERAKDFEQLGIKAKDAIHLAAAESAACDVFLTTDRGILKKVQNIGAMHVMNPVTFMMEVYHAAD